MGGPGGLATLGDHYKDQTEEFLGQIFSNISITLISLGTKFAPCWHFLSFFFVES